jgi:hypothetical protein
LTLPEGKKGREVLRCIGHTPEQPLVWGAFTAGVIRAYDVDQVRRPPYPPISPPEKREKGRGRSHSLTLLGPQLSVVCEHSIRPKRKSSKAKLDAEKEDEEDRERVNCLLPVGKTHLWLGTTKGIRTFVIQAHTPNQYLTHTHTHTHL